ncbi:MAG: UvrD-helicase domain-containing protein [Akkermansiaceae bacterium]|nr:UvrD-helicase domain-containing protein [Akkermansiaceae bacterium]
MDTTEKASSTAEPEKQLNIGEPNLLILASAGSGKTFQLANRIIHLVVRGEEPAKIVALTFTRKAAGEFSDSVLIKLAKAAKDAGKADELRMAIQQPNADFRVALERVVQALPNMMLGTMDGFFSKMVRGFQYEFGVTGGKFDLLEGPRAVAATNEILTNILSEEIDDGGADEFLYAFRRASMGKEHQGVIESLRKFVRVWQGIFRNTRQSNWGPAHLAGVDIADWEASKIRLMAQVMRGLDGITYTDKRQRNALAEAIDSIAQHTIGSGSLGDAKGLLLSILSEVNGPIGPLQLKYHKEFVFGGLSGDALREMILLAARCEMAAALQRTRAVWEIISIYDERCESELRSRGLLGFDDIKHLMGRWRDNEKDRLTREAIDFRLDARYDHWLLDEFQDTSRSDWTGLSPLVDEAFSSDDRTVFIVGDRKQAIYGWRGGDVRLFDEIIENYGDGLAREEMADSWRSCPEVLELVNAVCGDPAAVGQFFGETNPKWEWQQHTSAKRLAEPDKRGEARVEIVEGKLEERLERLSELLDELGVGEKNHTCGVLLRTNATMRKVADHLREKGFDVIEEGARQPSKDNPVGVALAHLLKWLADPSDAFAKKVIEMSPIGQVLTAKFGEAWQQTWERLLEIVATIGFAGMVEVVIREVWMDWSDFGRRRAGDIMAALAKLDAQGGATAQQAADWIANLEVSQSPGRAAVQVMTIHKSKGLGFDIVVLPDVPDEEIPQAQKFEVAEHPEWISQTPPKWARELIPEMVQAESRWAMTQRYEAVCMLYVAITRAKRGLYILLEAPGKSKNIEKPTLSNWLLASVGSKTQTDYFYQVGRLDWVDLVEQAKGIDSASSDLALTKGITRRERTTPSGLKKSGGKAVTHSGSGMKFGSEVHAAFEQVGWVDEVAPMLPRNDAGRLVAELLEAPSLRELFLRNGKAVELFCEQPIDAIVDNTWLSGVIDRLHLHRDGAGLVRRVEVIDYKTDGVEQIEELVERYSQQMLAYQQVMQIAYPDAEVACILVSTRFKQSILVN